MISLSSVIQSSSVSGISFQGVFVETNEAGSLKTLEKISKQEMVGNTAMGVSGFFTLHAASVRTKNVEHIVMFDNEPAVQRFWGDIEAIVVKEPNRQSTVQKICDLLYKNREIYFRGFSGSLEECAIQYAAHVLVLIDQGNSWLSTDERYQKIRQIFLNKNFHFLLLDLADTKGFEVLKREFECRKMVLDFLYLSNIAQYAFIEKTSSLCVASLEGLVTDQTIVIDTTPVDCEDCVVHQRVHKMAVSNLFHSRAFNLTYCREHPEDPEDQELCYLANHKIKQILAARKKTVS